MDKNKSILPLILGIVFCLAFMLSSENVEAHTITINNPGTGALVNGTFNFTATVDYASSDGDNISNVTWYYRLGTTGDWTIIGSSINATAEVIFSNFTDTSAIADGTTYQINATAFTEEDGTTFNASDVNTVIAIDNTDPTVVIKASPLSLRRRSMKGFEVDCSSSTDAVDSALTVTFYLTNSDGTTTTQTKTNVSSNELTYTFDDNWELYNLAGTYTATCRIYDNREGFAGVEATNVTDLFVTSATDPLDVLETLEDTEEIVQIPFYKNKFYQFMIIVIIAVAGLFLLTMLNPKKGN